MIMLLVDNTLSDDKQVLACANSIMIETIRVSSYQYVGQEFWYRFIPTDTDMELNQANKDNGKRKERKKLKENSGAIFKEDIDKEAFILDHKNRENIVSKL